MSRGTFTLIHSATHAREPSFFTPQRSRVVHYAFAPLTVVLFADVQTLGCGLVIRLISSVLAKAAGRELKPRFAHACRRMHRSAVPPTTEAPLRDVAGGPAPAFENLPVERCGWPSSGSGAPRYVNNRVASRKRSRASALAVLSSCGLEPVAFEWGFE